MSAVIFTAGLNDDDNDITSEKGHRSDVFYRDNHGLYHELNFISFDRLKIELVCNIEKEKKYFTDAGLVVLEVVTTERIIDAVRGMIKSKYFSSLKGESKNVEEFWTVLPLE